MNKIDLTTIKLPPHIGSESRYGEGHLAGQNYQAKIDQSEFRKMVAGVQIDSYCIDHYDGVEAAKAAILGSINLIGEL